MDGSLAEVVLCSAEHLGEYNCKPGTCCDSIKGLCMHTPSISLSKRKFSTIVVYRTFPLCPYIHSLIVARPSSCSWAMLLVLNVRLSSTMPCAGICCGVSTQHLMGRRCSHHTASRDKGMHVGPTRSPSSANSRRLTDPAQHLAWLGLDK